MSRKTGLRRRQNAVKEDPALKAAKLCRAAKLAIAQGNLNLAEESYGAAIECGTLDPEAFNDLATIYDKKGVKAEERFKLLSRAFELAPQHPVIRRNYLNLLQRLLAALEQAGRFREALPLHLRRVAVEPESAPAQRALGYCYGKLGQSEAAVAHFTRATTLDPNHPGYHNDLGLAWLELHQLSEARAAFQRVLELDPQSVRAFIHLGLLANIAGLTEVAVNMVRRALQVDPNCVEAHNNLAMFLRDQGELVECRRHYHQALHLKPDQTSVFSGYLLSLNDDPAAEPDWVAAEHRRFNEIVKPSSRPLAPRSLHPEKHNQREARLLHLIDHAIAKRVKLACLSHENYSRHPFFVRGLAVRIDVEPWQPGHFLKSGLDEEVQVVPLVVAGHAVKTFLLRVAQQTANGRLQVLRVSHPRTSCAWPTVPLIVSPT
jgi:Flp pilus assembly protein TadD